MPEQANGDRPDNDVVGRTFAGMLGELEDVATTLTNRQAALARELADVEAELHRVEAVRAAMAGAPLRRKATAKRSGSMTKDVRERVDKTLAWAREREGEFTGSDVAEFLGTEVQGVGPMLAGMARREELSVRTEGKRRFYSVA